MRTPWNFITPDELIEKYGFTRKEDGTGSAWGVWYDRELVGVTLSVDCAGDMTLERDGRDSIPIRPDDLYEFESIIEFFL